MCFPLFKKLYGATLSPKEAKQLSLSIQKPPLLVGSLVFVVKSINCTDKSVNPECPSEKKCEYNCSPQIPLCPPPYLYTGI